MRDEHRFEIERAFDLLPHVVGASWATLWFRLNGIKTPTETEFRNKTIEYFKKLDDLCVSFPSNEKFEDIRKFIEWRKKEEIKKIQDGENKEIEKRYQRYVDYG